MDENPYPVNTSEWFLYQQIISERAVVQNSIDQQAHHLAERNRHRELRTAAEVRIARHEAALAKLAQV